MKKKSSASAGKTSESRAFREGLLRRGEAVPPPSSGRALPAGATHTLEPSASGTKLVRKRFSLF
jgi:hypothetical protein